MTDGVTYQDAALSSPSVGTEVATDDCGAAGHVQLVKLAQSANGDATPITADADGLEVKVTNAPLAVTGTVASTVTTYDQAQASSGLTTGATPYSLGDVLGAGWTFTSAVAASGGRGRLTGVVLLDKGDVTVAVDLWLASASITFGTDNAAPSISDTDAEKIVGTISLSMQDLGNNRIGSLSGISVPYVCDATSLFVYAVTRTAHNQFAAASDLRLHLFAEL